jgi:mannose-1-phosphate guanylyltransferase
VTPSDHLILKEDQFIEDLQKGLEFVKENNALVTLGIKPSRPEISYGYIQSSEKMIDEFTKVKTFTEKPDFELAKVFVKSGEFFWNSGMFIWNVDTIINALRKFLPDISAIFENHIHVFNTKDEKPFIEEHFLYCPTISIDYGVMEKADNVYMLCVDFGWADLGTWGSIFDIAQKDESNNAVLQTKVLLYESENNIVELDNKDRVAVIQGLKDYIVAESGNVLMICKKKDEDRIKQFMADAFIKYGEKYK